MPLPGWSCKAIRLVRKKFMRIRNTILFVPLVLFFQQSLSAQNLWPFNEWSVSSPALQKMSANVLQVFDTEIANGKFGHVDEMLVTRHGNIVYQSKYQHDYDRLYGAQAKKEGGLNHFPLGGPYNYYNSWWHPYYHSSQLHTLQSVTKSVVSVVIGTAVARNEFPDLSTAVLNFFDTTLVKNMDDRKRRMTIRQLLTMTGGFDWEEWISVEDPNNDCFKMEGLFDWVQYVIDKPMVAEPGQKFTYSSGGAQLLSYIFRKATGKDIEEYAAEHLFKPLGIGRYYWKRTPTGLADTEGGLYLNTTDLAKIGYLYLRGGNCNGKQLVTNDWVKASVTPSSSVSQSIQYGYLWWLIPYGTDKTKYAWCCRGFGGQSVVIIAEYDMVAVFTGWSITEGVAYLDVPEIIKKVVVAVLDK